MTAFRWTPAAPARPRAIEASVPRPDRGALPLIVLAAAAGVLLVSVADALSRTGHGGGSAPFWIGLGLIVVPATARLTRADVGRLECVVAPIVVGLALYGVKVLRDPFAFTYGDELAHVPNLQSILATGHLFGQNSILQITPRYPGLETVTALVVRAAGLSPYASGVVVIAAGRALIMLGLFLIYERVSHSARAAALGAVAYAATPNFLLWSGQFAYESIALPVATVAIFALLRWGQTGGRAAARLPWVGLFTLLAAAIVITHHVTSYFLVVFAVAACVLHWMLLGRRGAPWVLAAIAVVFTGLWLTTVAGHTTGYLSPVLTRAVDNVISTINRESGTRGIFSSQSGTPATPPIERVVAVIGILLLGLATLWGLRAIWRTRWRRRPLLALLALFAVAYMGTLPLRLVPDAWETASRLGDFLFVGTGLVVALGVVALVDRRREGTRRRRALLAAGLTIVFASGVIAGWPAYQQLADPREVAVAGRTLQPPSVVAAQWSGRTLGASQRVFARDADARFFLVYGHQPSYAGNFRPDVDDLLADRALTRGWRAELRSNRVTLVVADQRQISLDNLFGFFFDVGPAPLLPARSVKKFDTAGSNRLYDGGNIVIYGVRGLW